MSGRNITLAIVGVLVLIVVILGACTATTYNSLVTKDTNVDTRWSQVQNQYQRRFDLIPNLVESVKGIFEQEREVFGLIAEARTRYAAASSRAAESPDNPPPDVVTEYSGATIQLESALARLLVIVENYPELRSQQNVTGLMDELSGTENRVATERGRFIDATQEYNLAVKRFPSSIIAGLFGYEQRANFTAADEAATPPAVRF